MDCESDATFESSSNMDNDQSEVDLVDMFTSRLIMAPPKVRSIATQKFPVVFHLTCITRNTYYFCRKWREEEL